MADKEARNFMLLLYEETESYSLPTVLDIATHELFSQWAYIEHTSDLQEDGQPKKKHIHLVGKCKNPKYLHQVAEKLGIDKRFVEVAKNWKSALRYLVHADDPDKYQYNAADVKANFEYNTCLDMSGIQQGRMILDEIINTRHTCTSLMSWAIQNGCYSQYIRGFAVWSQIMKEMYERDVSYRLHGEKGSKNEL